MAKYLKQWSSATPGLLIIMVDQSGSMSANYIENESKASFAAKAVNNAVYSVIQRNMAGEAPKDRCQIVIIGYNGAAKIIRSAKLSELSEKPLKMFKDKKKVLQPDGTFLEIPFSLPVWLEPESNGSTNMADAFLKAEAEINARKYDGMPLPVILNISDGAPNTGGGHDEVRDIALRIMQRSPEGDSTLIYNAQIETNSFTCIFPSSYNDLPNDANAHFLFDISSEIRPELIPVANANGLYPKEGARGCIVGCDAERLLQIVSFGSTPPPPLPVNKAEGYED